LTVAAANAPQLTGRSEPRLAPPVPVASRHAEFEVEAKAAGIKLLPWQSIASRYITATAGDLIEVTLRNDQSLWLRDQAAPGDGQVRFHTATVLGAGVMGAQIAAHLANDNYFFCNNFGAMKGARPAPDTATADSVKATWPKAQLMTSLRASFEFCNQAINQVDDAKLAEPVTMTFGGNTRTVARANMVLGNAMDLTDHYSQLANYMRLNNILPPTALPRPRPAGS